MANTTRLSRERCVCGTATTAEVIAGKLIVPPDSAKAVIVTGGWMRATGSADTATSVDIKDTTDTPVVAVAIAVAALIDGAVVDFDAAANVTWTTYGVAHTKGKGLQILQTTAAGGLGTTTAVDYVVRYILV